MLLPGYNFIFNIADLTIFTYSLSASRKIILFQILKVAGLLGGKFYFSVLPDLKFKAIVITKPQNQVLPCESFKRYLNEKNPMHGRETGTIHKFSTLIFET